MKKCPFECSARVDHDESDGEGRFLLHHAVEFGAPLQVIDKLLEAWPGAVMETFWEYDEEENDIIGISLISAATENKPECVPSIDAHCFSPFVTVLLLLSSNSWCLRIQNHLPSRATMDRYRLWPLLFNVMANVFTM